MILFDFSTTRRDYMVLAQQFVSEAAKMFCRFAVLGMMDVLPRAP
jgi:hypothetical protein